MRRKIRGTVGLVCLSPVSIPQLCDLRQLTKQSLSLFICTKTCLPLWEGDGRIDLLACGVGVSLAPGYVSRKIPELRNAKTPRQKLELVRESLRRTLAAAPVTPSGLL